MSTVAPLREASSEAPRAVRARRRVSPLWGRSAVAFGGGFIAAATLMVNIAWLPFLSLAAAFTIVLFAAFPVWIAFAYYAFAAQSQAAAWRTLALVALPSILLNLLLHAR